MDWVRVFKELRLGMVELTGVKALAYWLIALVFICLLAGRGFFLAYLLIFA